MTGRRRALAPALLASLLLMPAGSVTWAGTSLPLCYGYGCKVRTRFDVGDADIRELEERFAATTDAESERAAIAYAIGALERVAARQTPIGDDRGGNFNDGTSPGKRDCVDHSTTNNDWLEWIAAQGWLHHHRPAGISWRAPWIVDLHYTAVVAATDGSRWAVDSWFFDNGHDAAVIPLPVWNKGFSPE